MTPQQLKALLPPVQTTESSNDNTTNSTEKLYNATEIGNHFQICDGAIRYYVKQNKIAPSKTMQAKFGLSHYYKLSDFKNYKPIKRMKKSKCIINDNDNSNYNYTVLQIANHYKLSRQQINNFIRLRKIKSVNKISSTRPAGSRAMLRHVKFADFNFLNKQNHKIEKEIKSWTIIQRIKLLFGLYN